MKNELAPRNNQVFTAIVQDMQSQPSDELRQVIHDAIELTANQIVRIAAAVRILEDRGEDLTDLKISMMDYIRKVAHGQLAPEAFVQFAHTPMLLRHVSRLALPDQVRVASGNPMEILEQTPDGEWTNRMVPPLTLSRDEIYQVFAEGRIRNTAEQRSYLKDHQPNRAAHRRVQEQDIVLDSKRGGATINGRFVSRKELLDILGRLEK